jgi:cytochrome c peroxidase
MRSTRFCYCAALGLLVVVGCQPAGKYGPPRGTRTAVPTEPVGVERKVDPPIKEEGNDSGKHELAPMPMVAQDAVWEEPDVRLMEPPVPIQYYTEAADRNQWLQLENFWNITADLPQRLTPEQAAVLVGASPWNLGLGPLAGQIKNVVKIKVPLGLDDPLATTPPANRPTLGKWELGKLLFFDEDVFLQNAKGEKTSCAACHVPAKAYSDGKVPRNFGEFVTPRLLNVAYGSSMFWDGRVGAVEEVVQRSTEDATGDQARHSWPGSVQRLRENAYYDARFRKVFGTRPTQDAVGKAIATYLRTVLSGNSLQDRAEREMRQRGAKSLEVGDYEKVLDEAALKSLEPGEGMAKDAVARQLHQGYTLFHGKANCVNCHGGNTYTDNSFHNVGIGLSAMPAPLAGREIGRFAVLPPGLKDRRMIGAYKTPSLRSVPRSGPLFHDGIRTGPDVLFEAVTVHFKEDPSNPWLDPAIRKRDVSEAEIRALVLFLKALDGEAPSVMVSTQIETAPAPKPKK